MIIIYSKIYKLICSNPSINILKNSWKNNLFTAFYPLNPEAIKIKKEWKAKNELLFWSKPSITGATLKNYDNVHNSFSTIKNFTWNERV